MKNIEKFITYYDTFSSECLVLKKVYYNFDYVNSKNSTLSAAQQQQIEENIPGHLAYQTIGLDQLVDYNWDKLIEECRDSFNLNSHYYDKLVALIWEEQFFEEVFSNTLIHTPPPKGFDKPPAFNPSFLGTEKDLGKEAVENNKLGNAGEQLVILREKQELERKGLAHLAAKVEKMPDGKGYDILSFFADGSPKHIEVKTTKGNEQTPFYYTLNELEFARRNHDSYCIYRLFLYDEKANFARYYTLENPLKELHLEATLFKAYPKEKTTNHE